jgi:hypothetical protein
MGMFNWVDAPAEPCPATGCDGEVTGWQSKDNDCCLAHVKVDEVGNYYSGCDRCDCWIEYRREGGGRRWNWRRAVELCRRHEADPNQEELAL